MADQGICRMRAHRQPGEPQLAGRPPRPSRMP
jgi:hypothetical protein